MWRKRLLLAAATSILVAAPFGTAAAVAAPPAPVIVSPADGDTVTTPSITVSGTAPALTHVALRINGTVTPPVPVAADGTWSATRVAMRPPTTTITATTLDRTGSSTPTTVTVNVVPSAPPLAPAITGPSQDGTSEDATFTLSGTAPGASSVRIFEGATQRSGAAVSGDGTWTVTLYDVSNGPHTYVARAIDGFGQFSPDSAPRTVDVQADAPDTTLTGGPAEVTSDRIVFFDFQSSKPNGTFECRLDGPEAGTPPFTACGFGEPVYRDLPEGRYTFEVFAVDRAGNRDETPASRTFTVDLTAPPAPAITAPAEGATVAAGPLTVTGTADPLEQVTVQVDGVDAATTTAAADGTWSVTVDVVAGAHEVAAVAGDAAGNTSPAATRTVTVGTRAPVYGVSARLTPAAGTVRIGASALTGERLAPLGAEIDARDGRVQLATAPSFVASLNVATLSGGPFVVSQRSGVTELRFSGALACAEAPAPTRALAGSTRGVFRVRGDAGTVYATGNVAWSVEDTCAGTRTTARDGAVLVHDRVRNRMVLVREGSSYLARR